MRTPTSEACVVDTVSVGPFMENTFFLRRADRDEVVIIDPGDEAERLAALVEAHEWRPVAIVNTHGHLDHMGAVQPLKQRFDLPFYLHAAERPTLARAPADAHLFGVPEPEIPAVDFDLVHGADLELAGLRLAVHHTPGHTPGSVSLVVNGRVFTGDALFYGSIGRTDLPGGDFHTLMSSIFDRLLTLPDETIVHSGHGPDTSIGRERRHNPFLAEDPRTSP